MNKSLLTIMNHILPLLEEEFVKMEPKMQEDLLAEAQMLMTKIESWVASKVKAKA